MNAPGVVRSAALLTTGYAVGQVLGPLAVTPLLGNGYRTAMLVTAVMVLTAAVAAALLRVRYPAPAAMTTSPGGPPRFRRKG